MVDISHPLVNQYNTRKVQQITYRKS